MPKTKTHFKRKYTIFMSPDTHLFHSDTSIFSIRLISFITIFVENVTKIYPTTNILTITLASRIYILNTFA